MGCFLDCFVKKKERRRRNKSTKRVQPNDQRNGCDVALHHAISLNQEQRVASDEPLEPTIYLNKDSTERPIAPVEEARDKLLDEPLSFGTKKKVTFDLNVQTYENNSSQEDEKYESGEEKEQKGTTKLQMQSEDGSSTTLMGSFPSNHRYQNCSISDDEYEAESECSDLEYDSDDYFDDEDEYDDQTVQEEISKSISQRGLETRVDEKEVNSTICPGSQYNRSVLSPIENLSQWKAVKMSSKPPLKQQKEKTDLETVAQIPLSPKTSFTFSSFSSSTSKTDCSGSPNIAVDTSFSNWLNSSEATPSSKTGNFSFGTESAERSMSPRSISPQSYEDRPILGALTVEELRQFSATSSPRKSPSRSPDEMPIFGNVGSYWSHTEQASDSTSSSPSNGIGNATSRYREVFVK